MNNNVSYAMERLEVMSDDDIAKNPLLYSSFINVLIAELTAFKNMGDMVSTDASYRPSLNVSCLQYGLAFSNIADAYDRVMAYHGDSRKAYRF